MKKQAQAQAHSPGADKAASGKDDPACKVKNTFLEFSIPGEDKSGKRRTRSDIQDARLSPLVVASKSPIGSPILGPMDETVQAVPIDDVHFELLEETAAGEGGEVDRRPYDDVAGVPAGGDMVAQANGNLGRDEPAYVVPTTPSPFLHSAFPPTVPPPFSYQYGLSELGLPPAFSPDCDVPAGAQGGEGFSEVDSQFMQGLGFIPPEVPFDGGGFGYGGWPGGWGVQGDRAGAGGLDGGGGFIPARGGGAGEDVSVFADSCRDVDLDGAADMGSADLGSAPDVRPAKEGKRAKRNKQVREEERADRRTPARDGAGERGPAGADQQRAVALADKAEERRGAEAAYGGGAGNGCGGGDQLDMANGFTTVMLRNIPNKYTREMLIKQLCLEFNGLFDFMYLPIDFKNKCNVGYGFINFRTPEACEVFVSKFHGVDVRKCLPGLNSKKIVEVTPARVQGLSENVRRLKNSPVMNQLQDHPEWMPLLFNKDGIEEPFPLPDVPLPPVKPRGRNREARKDES
mmetsp:Transcript_41437/g.125202  ORF Transcript_41437/g.125202 Transcript_41437/m.125202 type:complete len:516 (-) Transcript_41437:148-1695(-)